jgi:hypothetical protein
MMTCPLDPQVLVLVVEPQPGLDRRFARSHAFSVYGNQVAGPFIVIDARVTRESWFTEDHLLVLIAHELAHILRCSADELQADLLALRLLLEHGHLGAYALLREVHRERLDSDWYEGKNRAA